MIQIIHIRNLEQALNHGLILKKVHRVIKLNQKDWLKPYIDMNTKLREKTKKFLQKFFALFGKAIFGKNMEYVTKYWDIKLVTAERRRNYLAQNQIMIPEIFLQKIY